MPTDEKLTIARQVGAMLERGQVPIGWEPNARAIGFLL
jgi:hypothetical protein